MKHLALLFDIDKLSTKSHKQDAFQILFKATTPEHLSGCSLWCGCTPVKIPGSLRPGCFCIDILDYSPLTPSQILKFQELYQDFSLIGHPALPEGKARFYDENVRLYLIHVADISLREIAPLRDDYWIIDAAHMANWRVKGIAQAPPPQSKGNFKKSIIQFLGKFMRSVRL